MISVSTENNEQFTSILPSLNEVLCRRTVARNGSSRRNVIRGDRVAEEEQGTSIGDGRNWRQLSGHVLKVGRVFDIRRLWIKVVQQVSVCLQRVPSLVARFDARVHLLEHGGNDALLLHFENLITRWPNVAQKDVLALKVDA